MLYMHKIEKKPRYSIQVMDLSSGKSQTLFEGIDFGTRNIFEWSPDGKKVAYRHQKDGLCVIDSNGGKPEVLWSYPDPNTTMFPLDWSLDGLHILVVITNEADATSHWVSLPAQGGEPNTLVFGKASEFAGLAGFSPDGKYVVGQKAKDIYVWPIEGGKEIRVTNHQANDKSPFWSPDGKYIVFVSDRAKTEDLWAIPMNGPNPAGAPVCIRWDLGKNTFVSDLTPGGKLTLLVFGSGGTPPDLFVIPVDPATGEAQGDLRPFAKYPTQHFLPRWSLDVTRIAYTSRKGNFGFPRLFISSGNDKEDLEIPVGDQYVVNVEWSRDGKHLIFPSILRSDGHPGILRVSLESHKIEPVHLVEKCGIGGKGMFINLRWLSKAGKFMFEKFVGENERELYTMDKEGKNIQLVAEKFSTDYWTWPSPDGRHVAYRNGQNLELLSLEDKTSATLVQFPEGKHVEGVAWSPDGKNVVWNDRKKLTLFSVSKGSSQTLVESDDSHQISGLGWNQPWAPDGKKIAYVLRESLEGSEAKAELWIVPATGGTPKKVASAPSSHPVIGEVTWHSNGDMIFVTGSPGKDKGVWYEHWIMENFLPKPTAGK
jgi:Tol biopolymer transport system component